MLCSPEAFSDRIEPRFKLEDDGKFEGTFLPLPPDQTSLHIFSETERFHLIMQSAHFNISN